MTAGHGCTPNLVGYGTIEKVEVQTEYLDCFTRNIQSFCSSSICVVSNIDETGKGPGSERIINFGLLTLYFF